MIEIFDALVLGLYDYLRSEDKYPYPPALQQSWNALAINVRPYPKTIYSFVRLMGQPLKSWWPFDLPDTFDADFGLTYDDDLSEEAIQYIYQEFPELAETPTVKNRCWTRIEQENRPFKRILDYLRSPDYGDRAQQDYVLLRKFLIEESVTTREKITSTFASNKITPLKVGELYEDYSTSEGWCCDRCGPLRKKGRHLRGISPSVCDDHYIEVPYVHYFPGSRGQCQVRTGIHLRTTLPGLPELSLFNAIESLLEEFPQHLKFVHLWPGIDRYDLRLEFSDGKVWAVDVKDHRAPDRLGRSLTKIYREGDLCYDDAFYVFTRRRIEAHPHYIDIVRENCPKLPHDHKMISETSFQELVRAKLMLLSKQGKRRRKTK